MAISATVRSLAPSRRTTQGYRRPVRWTGEAVLTLAGLAVTTGAGLMFVASAFVSLAAAAGEGQTAAAIEIGLFVVLAGMLMYGGWAYQLSRLGYALRVAGHVAPVDAALDDRFERRAAPLAVLVPSYQEESSVIRQTLVSAALQPHAGRRVVLLIDDRPNPFSAEDRLLLARARQVPVELQRLFAEWSGAVRGVVSLEPEAMNQAELRRYRQRLADGLLVAAGLIDGYADDQPVRTHTDKLYVERVLRQTAREARSRARAVLGSHRSADAGEAAVRRNEAWLSALFDVELSVFERKQYVNLSHEPNKAMNLNSYIGLLGGRWRAETRADGVHLVPATSVGPATLDVPDAEFVLTLDADSLLLPGYVARLMAVLESSEGERIGVIQTPYSAVPGAPGALEQMAGATTDVQYVIHQGFTHWNATFWVGANALIRKAALDDIVVADVERGHVIRRYIHDRTVIEDTESSVDLAAKGWELLNYPARLAYSATPPDFGSLIIQRRRWANGGLIIIPKLARYLTDRFRRGQASIGEALLRTHYLVSIAATNVALLLMLAFPFTDATASIWLPLAALPYIALYARDLGQAGYRTLDVVRVYALNLLLLPVNLAGALKSVEQGVTGRKVPFGRTPKIEGRTIPATPYLLIPVVLVAFWLSGALLDALAGSYLHASFAATNAVLMLYALHRFVGLATLASDVRSQSRLLRTFRLTLPRDRPTEPARLLPVRALFRGAGDHDHRRPARRDPDR